MSDLSSPVATPLEPQQAPVPEVTVVTAPAQIRPSHVAGGGVGGMLGAAIAVVLARYHVRVSNMDAAILGSACLSAGVGIGHVVGQVGLVGAAKRLTFGSKTA